MAACQQLHLHTCSGDNLWHRDTGQERNGLQGGVRIPYRLRYMGGPFGRGTAFESAFESATFVIGEGARNASLGEVSL